MTIVVAHLFAPFPGPGGARAEDLRRLGDRFGPETVRFIAEIFDAMDVMLLGRAAYEAMSRYWPAAAEADAALAARLNGLPKTVFSTTLEEPLAWTGSTLAPGDVAAEVRALAERGVPRVGVVGSRALARSLSRAGLLDGYRQLMDAVALHGRSPGPIFEDCDRTDLSLESSRILDSRLVELEYAVRIRERAAA